MTTSMDDYYKALGLRPGASKGQIRKAYKDLAKVWDPSKRQGDAASQAEADEKFRIITEAYEMLQGPSSSSGRPDSRPEPVDRAAAPSKAAGAGETVKCPGCAAENKESAKNCRKCGRDMAVPPAWMPDAKWHLRTLGVIWAALTVVYFSVSAVLSKLPRPYHLRHIPVEMTPWLAPGGKVHLPEDQLKAPPPPPDPAAPAAK